MKEVIINTGTGNLRDGFVSVRVELKQRGEKNLLWQKPTKLNPAPQLLSLLEEWRFICHNSLYIRSADPSRSKFVVHPNNISNYGEQDLEQLWNNFKREIDDWLNCRENFGKEVGDKLRNDLSQDDEILVIVASDDTSIWQLPWHLWDFVEQHPRSVEVFYHSSYEDVTKFQPTLKEKVDILALFGKDLYLEFDRDHIKLQEHLPVANIIPHNPTSVRDFSDKITQSKAPILFFSGHGTTMQKAGYISLNENLDVEIGRFIETFRKAVDNGLQIAMFNCCSGLGLASQLRDVNIPCMIVMRDKIPDSIAHQFLLDLMTKYSQNSTVSSAFIYARNRLKLNNNQNFALIDAYLPVLVLNPLSNLLTWQDLISPISEPTRSKVGLLKKIAVPIMSTVLMGSGLEILPQLQVENTPILYPAQKIQAWRVGNRSSEVVIVTVKGVDLGVLNNAKTLEKPLEKIHSPDGDRMGHTVTPIAWGLEEIKLGKVSNQEFSVTLIEDCDSAERDNDRKNNRYPLYLPDCQNSSLALKMLEKSSYSNDKLKSKLPTRLPPEKLILNRHIKTEVISADDISSLDAKEIKKKFDRRFIIFVPEKQGYKSDSALALVQIWVSRDSDRHHTDSPIPLLIPASEKDRTIWMFVWAGVTAIAMLLMSPWKSKFKFIPLAIIPLQILVGGALMMVNGDIFPMITTAIAMLVTWVVALASEKWRFDREDRKNARS